MRVSLVMGSYNPIVPWIHSALDSCRGFNEIIVVNDGSMQFPSIRKDARVIHHASNRGFHEARNTGIRAAQSDWIASLDDDDFFDCHGLNMLHSFAASQKAADIIHFPIIFFCDDRSALLFNEPLITIEKLCHANMLPSGSWFRKAVWEELGGFQHPDAEDWDFWLRAARHQYKMVFFPFPVYWYRFSTRSKWQKSVARFSEIRSEVVARSGN